jgi:hypothetical protein
MVRPPMLRVPVLALVLLAPASLALAQDEEPVAEGPPKVAEIQAVERGFFLTLDVGGNLMLNKVDDRSYGFGLLTGVFAGYDITPFISLSLGAAALIAPGSSDNAPAGDLFYLAPMAQLQFAFVTTERDFFYVKGGVGFGLGLPSQVNGQDFGGGGVAFRGLVGYEHYMRLRHFSLGAQLGISGVTAPGVGIGISFLPTVKYTF